MVHKTIVFLYILTPIIGYLLRAFIQYKKEYKQGLILIILGAFFAYFPIKLPGEDNIYRYFFLDFYLFGFALMHFVYSYERCELSKAACVYCFGLIVAALGSVYDIMTCLKVLLCCIIIFLSYIERKNILYTIPFVGRIASIGRLDYHMYLIHLPVYYILFYYNLRDGGGEMSEELIFLMVYFVSMACSKYIKYEVRI